MESELKFRSPVFSQKLFSLRHISLIYLRLLDGAVGKLLGEESVRGSVVT